MKIIAVFFGLALIGFAARAFFDFKIGLSSVSDFGLSEVGLPVGSPISKIPKYNHIDPPFSFQYPEGFQVTAFSHGDEGQVITVEREVSLPAEVKPPRSNGFQIFITPFDEPEISAERIRRDLPEIPLENIHSGKLDGTPALVFESRDPGIGETHEVWFAREGYLYQIMTYASFEKELQEILQTWKFHQ